ncbi:hypothetical protein DQ04_06071020 [Trypanosoma grayi]|uniref:hypothetical protein n=1 Tax=Trypanosoma grayi TaxID=71804 RepID=UPI0004F436E0|nr:hypothetical protein DQ04_06071020 [Trypanosoma grayi]KEG08970.1 hypothetical protein DQ04_06071020 [Trypanosoma grayi]
MEDQSLRSNTSSTRPPLHSSSGRPVQQTRPYSVQSPTTARYFTLRIAVEAAPVPPLPYVQQRKEDAMSVWEEPCATLRHRWRFIKGKELEFARPSYEAAPEAVEQRRVGSDAPGVRRYALEHALPLLQQQEQSMPRGVLVEKQHSGEGGPPAVPQLHHLRPKTWGVQRGWLEEVLQDDRSSGPPSLLVPCLDADGPQPSNVTDTVTQAAATGIELPSARSPSPDATAPTWASLAGETPATTDRFVRDDTTNEKLTSTETSTPRLPPVAAEGSAAAKGSEASDATTTAGDAAQRLRVTLLTASFQRLVDDVAETHSYSEKERVPLLRHASIFRELPLQSRYHEMHPLCNLRVASPDFRPPKETSGAAAAAAPTEPQSPPGQKRRLRHHGRPASPRLATAMTTPAAKAK